MSVSEASAVQEALAAIEEEIAPTLDRILCDLGHKLRQCHVDAFKTMLDIAEESIYRLQNEEE